jgi:hypothetical protein
VTNLPGRHRQFTHILCDGALHMTDQWNDYCCPFTAEKVSDAASAEMAGQRTSCEVFRHNWSFGRAGSAHMQSKLLYVFCELKTSIGRPRAPTSRRPPPWRTISWSVSIGLPFAAHHNLCKLCSRTCKGESRARVVARQCLLFCRGTCPTGPRGVRFEDSTIGSRCKFEELLP